MILGPQGHEDIRGNIRHFVSKKLKFILSFYFCGRVELFFASPIIIMVLYYRSMIKMQYQGSFFIIMLR